MEMPDSLDLRHLRQKRDKQPSCCECHDNGVHLESNTDRFLEGDDVL